MTRNFPDNPNDVKQWDTYLLCTLLKENLEKVFLNEWGIRDTHRDEAAEVLAAIEHTLTVRNYLSHASVLPSPGEVQGARDGMLLLLSKPNATLFPNITTAKTTIDGVGDVAAALQGHTVVLRDDLFRRFLLLQGLDILENRLNTVLIDKFGDDRYAFAHDVDYINRKKRTGGTDAKPKFLRVRPSI